MDNLWGGWDVRNKKHRHPNEDDFSFQQKFPKMCGLETAPPWFFIQILFLKILFGNDIHVDAEHSDSLWCGSRQVPDLSG